MRRICRSIRNFARREGGPTAVEYALMLGLIIALCLPTLSVLRNQMSITYLKASFSLRSANGS